MTDFTSDIHRLNAKRERERGGSTNRVFKSTTVMHARTDADAIGRAVAELRAGWSFARGEAIAAYRFAVHGADWSAPGFGDI
jgi:hypothetical protein